MTKATPLPTPRMIACAGLLATAAGIGIGRFVYTPILPPMVEALHLSKSEAGLIASANFLGYLAGALLASLPLPGSRRAWLLAALAVNAAALAAMGLAGTMPAFLALRLIAGIASAFVLVFGSALVLDHLASAGRSGLSAVHFAGVGTGIAVSAVLVAMLGDWRAMWLASAALAAAAGVAVVLMMPAGSHGWRRAVAEGKAPLSLILAYGLFGFGYIITATFIVAQVRGAPAIAPLEPYIWILFGLSAAPSVALWTRLAARWGILTAFGIAALIEATAIAASALWTSSATVLLAAVFVGGTFMGLTALGLIAARGRIALMTASFSAGQILGPAFAGYVFDATGSLSLPLLGAAAALVAAGALTLSRR
ncbi:MAG: YbfB/YjiJ family MFS transporter [Alphaproteobacteria bacterium]|nr:YbfB/YjiJ family MFS transporter [Alphaproteobacteria bacterium]